MPSATASGVPPPVAMPSTIGVELARDRRRPAPRPSAGPSRPRPCAPGRPSRSTPLMRVCAVNGTSVAPTELALADAVRAPWPARRSSGPRASRRPGSRAGRPRRARPRPRRAAGRNSAAWRLPSVIVPVLSSSSVAQSPAASTARPDIASTLRCTSRSMPAMPIADSSAPMVVGMRHTSRATRTTTVLLGAGVDRERLQRDGGEQEDDRQPGEQDVERDLVRRLLAARRLRPARSCGRGRSRPARAVMRTTIWSDSTRVPPVTAERSPPDSRITGADSPVMADSSTEAMPSMISPSDGIISPGGHDDDVAELELRRRRPARASRRAAGGCAIGLGAGLAQRVGLGLAAALGHRLGEVGEQHREPQPHGDEPGEHVLRRAGRRRGRGRTGRGEDAADLDHEHDRVADHVARVELARSCRPSPAARSAGSNSDRCCTSGARGHSDVDGAVTCSVTHRPSCSTIGPSATTGKKVRPTTMSTTPVSSADEQRRVGREGAGRRRARSACGPACRRWPAPGRSAGTGPTSIASPSVVLYQSVLPVSPPKAEPLLLPADVNA